MGERRTDGREGPQQLLGPDDVSPFVVVNPSGGSSFLLLGDHAGRAVPASLAGLGLGPEAMERHIAWDIGIAGLGERLASALDACFIRQTYSRLVIDCNRQPGAADAAPAVSDGTAIPGNVGLSEADMAVQQVSELMVVPTAEIIGRFPEEVQQVTSFSAAIMSDTANRADAERLIASLTGDRAAAAYRASGVDPLVG